MPKFSIVTACYQAEPFLDQFFDSLEEQDLADDELEVIAVDDGSDDGTFDALQRWKHRSRFAVTVLQKPNGGQASARNLGMEHATGEWLTFTDPDDWLDRDYFHNVRSFIEEYPEVKQVSAQLAPMHEQLDGSFRRRPHPLRRMFDGDQLHDLNAQPEYFSGSAPASFIRSDLVRKYGLEFDVEIRPNFEDAHFIARYLLSCPQPLLGLLESAVYFYRKRSDGTSTLQTSVAHPGRYTVVPERAYLDLLGFARRKAGEIPEWVQNLVLYDLSWFFDAEEAAAGVATAAVGPVADVFIEHLRKIVHELSPTVIQSFKIRWLNAKWRQILLHSFSDRDWSTDYFVMHNYDAGRDETRIACRFVGQRPDITVYSGTRPVDLSTAKVQTLTYFDHDLLFEWGCWVPAANDLVVIKNGERAELRRAWQGATSYRMTPDEIRGTAAARRAAQGGKPNTLQKVRTVATSRRQQKRVSRKYLAIARNVPVNARFHVDQAVNRGAARFSSADTTAKFPNRGFANAWVLIDRIHNSNDSAEVLFRYLRDNRPDINAWFTIEAKTPDYQRLVDDGYGDRVVAHGSSRWRRLMKETVVIASSHADGPIFDPPGLEGMSLPQWRRAFLQHGVIKDDLSAWLNPKRLDLIVVSTEDELQSFVGPDTAYVYSERETKLTGLPRFDQLQRARDKREAQGQPKDLVVVAPTWRHWLLQDAAPGSQRRELVEEFEDSDFVQSWSQFVGHPDLIRACEQQGLQLVMLPHPNLESALDTLEGLSGVEAFSYDQPDLHSFFARTSLLVTDYSSVAFNIAYLESPTVYFQFDDELMFSGGHVGRKGYFDYSTMGFGPVTHDVESAVDATIQMVKNIGTSGRAPEPWNSRIVDTFPYRDGRCSERVTREIENILAKSTVRSSTK